MPTIRIAEFDTWRPGYGNAVVTVYQAGTTTKASIFKDEALTIAADNPQSLEDREINGVLYGKFSVPLYTEQSYYLDVDSADQTGIERPPITDMAGIDISDSVVTPTGGSRSRQLDDLLGQTIWVENHGNFGSSISTATNTATLAAAIGEAAGKGGSRIGLPAGTVQVSTFSLSAGVVLCGEGRGITVLQSQSATRVATLTGDRSGFENITLDGISLIASSVGVFSKNINETHFHNFEIKRFETGLHCKGGQRADWENFYISNCTNGGKLHGDNGVGDGDGGNAFKNNSWQGGKVDLCTSVGIELKYVDKKCYGNSINDVGIESNTGVGLRIYGARYTKLDGSWFSGNTTNLSMLDGADTTLAAENTVVGFKMAGGSFQGGAAVFTGTCQDVLLDRVEINDVDFTLTNPLNNIVVRDCIEDSLVTISGSGTKYTRMRTINGDAPCSTVQTTDATATTTWSFTLDPGMRVALQAKVIGNQRNADAYGIYHIAQFAHRPVATLDYDAQTANFTLGDTLTGATSGATALVVADTDSGTTGTLSLREITGVFQDNEIIAGALGGSATVNGVISNPDAALLDSITSLQTAVETDSAWAVVFAVNNADVQVTVTGASSKTIDWTTSVQIVTA